MNNSSETYFFLNLKFFKKIMFNSPNDHNQSRGVREEEGEKHRLHRRRKGDENRAFNMYTLI